jgi:hypothetical protein
MPILIKAFNNKKRYLHYLFQLVDIVMAHSNNKGKNHIYQIKHKHLVQIRILKFLNKLQ